MGISPLSTSVFKQILKIFSLIGVGDRGAGGAGGLQPSHLWKILQKSAIIGQKIGLKSGKIFVNNGSFIRLCSVLWQQMGVSYP